MQVAKRARLPTLLGLHSIDKVAMSSFMSNTIQATKITSNLADIESLAAEDLIGTHDGSFHCDEALAVGMLKLLPQFANSTLVRTRNPALLAKCGIVVDVGAVYDADTKRFDHHQREFTGVLDGYKTKLSSAGLVYKHYGKDIIRELLKDHKALTPSFVDICYRKLYTSFVEHIDAIDNGISVSDGPARYHVSTTLSARVGHLNPSWNEEQTPEIFHSKFKEAVQLTCGEFVRATQSLVSSWWPARSLVQDALDSRFAVHPSGSIMVMARACPWKDHLFEIDNAEGDKPVLYVLYADTGGSWRIQAVPEDAQSFNSRKKLPSEWCGLRDQVLSDKCGEQGAIFIHASGFIGGHSTKEGALNMAVKALSLA